MEPTRSCTNCGTDWPIDHFYKSRNDATLKTWCLNCRRAACRRRYYDRLGREVPSEFSFGKGHPPTPPKGWVPPTGECECGCGKDTPIATRNNTRIGVYKGYPTRRLQGHGYRKLPDASTPKEVKLGNCWTTDDGYRMQWAPNHPARNTHKSVVEHRIAMELHLDRFLEPHEKVHHKNGNRADNRPENLELWKNGHHITGVRSADYHCPGCRCHEHATSSPDG